MKKIILSIIMMAALTSCAQQYYLFTGTYTNNGSKGIYVYNFDAKTGDLKQTSTTENVQDPSYLVVSNDGRYVYSVNETGGEKPGSVSAFSFDKKSGKLSFLNSQPSMGDHPCYIDINKSGKFVIAGNYSGGNLAVLETDKGSLKPAVQVIQHTGNSANKMRQEKAHVHMTQLSPDDKYLFVPDLGMDKIMVYPFNAKESKPLNEAAKKEVTINPGNGPRHLAFHPSKNFVYLIEELAGTVSVFTMADGNLKNIQAINAHPENFEGTKGSADIHVSPDGKFLYASNRGSSNTIAIFEIDQSSGRLTNKGFQSTLGTAPRNFVIDPTGNFLLVANQMTNTIVVFKRNKKTGMLTETGNVINVPSPVCLKFLKK
ncbi:MAG: lactonase family protein [Flavitalea sp.]